MGVQTLRSDARKKIHDFVRVRTYIRLIIL